MADSFMWIRHILLQNGFTRDAKVTLITRPRRFGKTTLFSTVETFFDPRFADHPEYFEKLRVWGDKEIRKLFGMVPVISISFGNCKGADYKQAVKGIADSFIICMKHTDIC